MKHLFGIAVVLLSGCVSAPETVAVSQSPAVTKCGPAPTRATGIGRPGSILGELTGGGETVAEFQQRQAIYALCARDDPSYPAVLAASIQADARLRAIRAQQVQDYGMQSQSDFWSMVNAQQQQQANFWNMVGAMNSGPR